MCSYVLPFKGEGGCSSFMLESRGEVLYGYGMTSAGVSELRGGAGLLALMPTAVNSSGDFTKSVHNEKRDLPIMGLCFLKNSRAHLECTRGPRFNLQHLQQQGLTHRSFDWRPFALTSCYLVAELAKRAGLHLCPSIRQRQ